MSTGASRSSPSTTPACRAASVQPPWTICSARPATARSVRAARARPIPAPTRICGAIVQPQPARGRSASAVSPPATRTTPLAIRIPIPADRCGIRAAPIAASGNTVTTSPAAAGDMRQPETSRSTSRKSAATRPPESRSNAAFALRCGLPGDSREGCASDVESQDRHERHERERHLHEEDRLSSRAAPSRCRPRPARTPRRGCRRQPRRAPREVGYPLSRREDRERRRRGTPPRPPGRNARQRAARTTLQARRQATRPRRRGRRR